MPATAISREIGPPPRWNVSRLRFARYVHPPVEMILQNLEVETVLDKRAPSARPMAKTFSIMAISAPHGNSFARLSGAMRVSVIAGSRTTGRRSAWECNQISGASVQPHGCAGAQLRQNLNPARTP